MISTGNDAPRPAACRCRTRAVAPNPMVGAVITAPDGRIIGQGWHRRFGGPHAEVNAVASVAEADRDLLRQSTIYVTLEPCSHYGKTPPCARLLAECRFARVVVGAGDPNPKVAGRGIAILKDAGTEVTEGVLADQCRSQNREFMFSTHTPPPMGYAEMGTELQRISRRLIQHTTHTPDCALAQGSQLCHSRGSKHCNSRQSVARHTPYRRQLSTAGNPRPPQPAPRQPRPHYGQQTHNTRYRQARHPGTARNGFMPTEAILHFLSKAVPACLIHSSPQECGTKHS